MSKCGSELGEINAQFVEGSFVVGEEWGKARCIPIGERKCKRKLEVSLQGLVMVESRVVNIRYVKCCLIFTILVSGMTLW